MSFKKLEHIPNKIHIFSADFVIMAMSIT